VGADKESKGTSFELARNRKKKQKNNGGKKKRALGIGLQMLQVRTMMNQGRGGLEGGDRRPGGGSER